MINSILSEINVNSILSNINSGNIIQMLAIASIVIAVIAIIFAKLKEAIAKMLRIAAAVIIIILMFGVQQGLLTEWLTKLTTYIK